MQTITNKIGQFLITNTVWIFMTTIVFVAYNRILIFMAADSRQGWVYLSMDKWQLFFQFAFSMMILFLPILLFAFFRNKLAAILNKWVFRGLWVYCFVIHTILMFEWQIDQYFSALRVHVDSPVAFGIALLVVELIILFNNNLISKLDLKNRLKQLKVEKAFLIVIIFIALLFSFPPFNRSIVGDGDLVFYAGEILVDFLKWLLLFLVGYVFYRINHYLLIEKILKTRGIFYYFFAFIGLAMLFIPIFAVIIEGFLVSEQTWIFQSDAWIPKGERTSSFRAFPNDLPWLWMFLSIPFILVYQWWKQQNDIMLLEKEKSAAELNALKQQINPHFLFNTLNSLYALGIEEKGEKTADGIAKLGTLMRYNLNDAQKTYIPLSKEIDYIKNYIELQRLRLSDNNRLTVNIKAEGKEDYYIAPLLLIPLVENAFKFGLSARENTHIKLDIELKGTLLIMHIFNTIPKNIEQAKGNGIGITNTRKRLASLHPKAYELIIEETTTEFETHLEIELRKKA